jgi:hypothetical protein
MVTVMEWSRSVKAGCTANVCYHLDDEDSHGLSQDASLDAGREAMRIVQERHAEDDPGARQSRWSPSTPFAREAEPPDPQIRKTSYKTSIIYQEVGTPPLVRAVRPVGSV